MNEGGDEPAASPNQASEWLFFIDENLSPNIAKELRTRDIEAEHSLEARFEGADDFDDILPYCRNADAVLVTNNVRDFNSTTLGPQEHAGIVIVHDKARPADEIAAELQRMVAAYQDRQAFRGFESADDW